MPVECVPRVSAFYMLCLSLSSAFSLKIRLVLISARLGAVSYFSLQFLIVIITSWFAIALDEVRTRQILREKADCKQSISQPALLQTTTLIGTRREKTDCGLFCRAYALVYRVSRLRRSPLACLELSRAVTLQRKIRDCSQSTTQSTSLRGRARGSVANKV